MKDTDDGGDWLSLCEMASKETNPQKLLELITKINRALEECRQQNRSDDSSLKRDTILLPIGRSSECHLDPYRLSGEHATIEYDC